MDSHMRSLTSFACEGALLGATLDDAAGTTGLLIVTGGTEIRIGAHGGLARLAAATAAAGFPTLRFDRRGVGDSAGEDPGFAASGPDIAAAVRHLRTLKPDLTRVLGFGLCDGATALALHHRAAGINALILANPWVVEPDEGLPPPAAIRRRYADRLLSVEGWRKLLGGGMDYRAALRGLRSIVRKRDPGLAAGVAAALERGERPVTVVLASGDATAIAFAEAFAGETFARVRAGTELVELASRSHSFAAGDDPDRLAAICIAALGRAG
jgi:exosortase A-associated hydrolase 1